MEIQNNMHSFLPQNLQSVPFLKGLYQSLGLILFLVYINNITDSIPTSDIYLLADDTTLFVKVRTCMLGWRRKLTKKQMNQHLFTMNKLKSNAKKQNTCVFKLLKEKINK